MKQRRLLFAADTLPPVITGVSTVLAESLRIALERGWQVSVLGPRQPTVSLPREVRFLALPSLPAPVYPEMRLGFGHHRWLRRHLGGEMPDHVHVLTPFSAGLVARSLSRFLKIPCSAEFLTDFAAQGRFLGFRGQGLETLCWRYLQWFYRPFTAVFAPSIALVEKLRERGFSGVRFRPSGVNVEFFGPEFRDPNFWCSLGLKSPVVLYVGRLSQEKNVRFLVGVARELPEFTFAVVGDGPDRSSLERTAPSNVRFTGVLRGESLRTAFASAHLFFFPSLLEAGAGSPLEAMASGLPVVALRNPGLAGVVTHGETGYLVHPDGSPRLVAQMIRDLLDQEHLWTSLSDRARRRAEAMDWRRSFAPVFAVMEANR